MQLESLSCNNCGAPVDVTPTTNYLTCAHCGSRLAVKRTETAHYTEALDRLQAHAARVDYELQDLRIKDKLLRLDHEWEEMRQMYIVSSSNGDVREPSVGLAITIAVLTAVLAIGLCGGLVTASAVRGDPIYFFLLIILDLIVGSYAAIAEYRRHKAYEKALEAYNNRRDALLSYRFRD